MSIRYRAQFLAGPGIIASPVSIMRYCTKPGEPIMAQAEWQWEEHSCSVTIYLKGNVVTYSNFQVAKGDPSAARLMQMLGINFNELSYLEACLRIMLNRT
jgi:hypothetical protein